MGRNSHHRKKLFSSSCSIMTAWAPERFVSRWATPFPVLFSPAWQLIYWLPIQFCLPSEFFTACFIALLSFLHSFLGHGGVDSWQVIVINHVHESNLLCLSEENMQQHSSFPGKFYCLSFGVFSIVLTGQDILLFDSAFSFGSQTKKPKSQALLLYVQRLYDLSGFIFFPLLAEWISCNWVSYLEA